MIRLLIFALLVLALGYGFSWLADRPGDISLVWEGQLYEMQLQVAAVLLVVAVAAVMLVWWLLRSIWTSPHRVTRFFRARKRDRGYQALSTGMIAAGAGNALLARKMSARARGLLRVDQEPLIQLLDAQAAMIEGKHDEARRKFEQMAEDPETAELGLRGLYLEAKRLGADEAARQYAERAVEKAPYLPWAAQAALETRCQLGNWDNALTMVDQQKVAKILTKEEARRKRAALLTARANDRLEGDPKGAREDAMEALRLEPEFVPAAIAAGKAYLREDNLRKAASVLEQAWKLNPHPQIAEVYINARGGTSAVDRLKRAEKLESLKPNNLEGLIVTAHAALDAKEFSLARQKAEAAMRMEAREGICLLLADIEDAETGDQGRVRYWMNAALRAPRDPAWIADGFVSEKWLPVSPVTGKLDAFEWKAPFTQMPGAIENSSSLPPLPPLENKAPTAAPDPVPEARVETSATIIEADLAKPVAKPPAEPVEAKTAEPVAEVRKVEPAKPKPVTETVAAKPAKNREEEQSRGIEDPFFGRPPDDPGVKDASKETEPKTRLRLF
ncbi:heme biosynthesis HemY N-terminal domain-containing protein [Rhizobium sp. PAMB 3182]